MINIKFYLFCFYKYIKQIVNKKYFTKYHKIIVTQIKIIYFISLFIYPYILSILI